MSAAIPRILCLYVRHGAEQYQNALPVLDAWYESHGMLAQRTLWIIDNSLHADAVPQVLAPSIELRAGDNTAWEFSAWAKAMRELREESSRYDIVHFVTSAFNTLYTRYLEHFRPDMLAYALTQHACLGHIDSYDRPIELVGAKSESWIRTCFFFLPYEDATRIAPWAAFSEPHLFFKNVDTTEFREDAPFSTDYQRRIRTWLEGNEVGGHTWHSPIAPGEAERFRKKTLAIVNEHHLSIVLRRLNVPLVDYCWLHTSGDLPGAPYPEPPPELQQLKVRRRVLGIPEALG